MTGKSAKKISVVVSVFLLLALIGSPLMATENGGTIYPGGNEDFMMGALPPPGLYFLDYFLYFHSGSFDDLRLPPGSGPVSGLKVKDVFGEEADIDLDVFANVFRFVYVTPVTVFGASWAMHLIVPVLNVEATIDLPFNIAHLDDTRGGIGDLTVNPLIFGWHFNNLHVIAGVDFNLPTGSFKANRVANPGRNYWEFEPVLVFTYLTKQGFEASVKFMYDFNTENPETDYTSGQEFHFDYLLGKHIGNWKFGINGQFYIQTTDDDFPGEAPGFDGNKGRAFSIGPAVLYQYKNMFFDLKYQFERIAVENRPEGDKLWFKFLYAF